MMMMITARFMFDALSVPEYKTLGDLRFRTNLRFRTLTDVANVLFASTYCGIYTPILLRMSGTN